MKKVLLMFFIFMFLFNPISFAYSESFDLMIEVMGISIKNVHGKILNEEIFNKYSLFVYGSPIDGYSGQRWKNVDGGLWNNGSNQGEYWILGENEEGYEVHNHKFPADIEPPTTPEQWRYAYIPDAQDSWLDQSKYMDDFQKEYMLNTNLMRNDVTYNITANQIGTDKVRLENYATWKTKGSVYTQRYDMNNQKWAANFMVMPMAADASLEGYADFPNGLVYNLEENETSIIIPIDYGCEVTNLSDFAKPEHVKEIKSEIYINDALIDSINSHDKISINKSTNYLALKSDSNTLVLNVKVKSSLLTKFTTDGALADIKNYTVIVYFGEEKEEQIIVDDTYYNNVKDSITSTSDIIPPPSISSIEINRIKGGKEVSLLVAKSTNTRFVCAGQTIDINVIVKNSVDRAFLRFDGDSSIFTFDNVTKQLEWDEPRSRNVKTFFSSLQGFKNMYNKTIKLNEVESNREYTQDSYRYIIPYGTKQTLNSWSTLREKSNDAFSINEKQLFSRIRKPYEIVITAEGFGGTDTKRIELDVFERWDTLYNRDIKNYVSNGEYDW